MSALKDLGQWRAETDAHLARLDLVTEQHGEDLRAKRGADNKTLTAIRETQTEHGQKLDSIQITLDNLAGGLRKVDRASESLQADMGMVKGRLSKVEDKLDKIDVRLDKMDDRFDKMDDRFDKMDVRFDKMDVRLDKMGEKLDLLLSR